MSPLRVLSCARLVLRFVTGHGFGEPEDRRFLVEGLYRTGPSVSDFRYGVPGRGSPPDEIPGQYGPGPAYPRHAMHDHAARFNMFIYI
jgi:hypothetical protein